MFFPALISFISLACIAVQARAESSPLSDISDHAVNFAVGSQLQFIAFTQGVGHAGIKQNGCLAVMSGGSDERRLYANGNDPSPSMPSCSKFEIVATSPGCTHLDCNISLMDIASKNILQHRGSFIYANSPEPVGSNEKATQFHLASHHMSNFYDITSLDLPETPFYMEADAGVINLNTAGKPGKFYAIQV